jgi:hypothetical protein
LELLEANETWEVVERPNGANVVGSKWVFKLKCTETGDVDKYKARLIAQGFTQVPGIDYFNTFAPIAKLSSTRAILAVAASNSWLVEQMDMKSVYLNSILPDDEVIYMCPPPGFKLSSPGNCDRILRLKKVLCGLKQSGRLWYKTFCDALECHGLMCCKVDHAVFYRHSEAGILLLLVHVNNLLIVANSPIVMSDIKKRLEIEFKMTDLGPVHWHVGLNVACDWTAATISLSQHAYISSILAHFGLEDAKPLLTPMDPAANLSKDQSPQTSEERTDMSHVPYCKAVGALMYAAVGMRPDIAFAVGILARFAENPGCAHWEAAKHVFRYLKGTVTFRLVLGGHATGLLGYTDADGNSNKDRHAISGYIFLVNGGAISWSSKRQEIISLSTTESKYVAAMHAAKEAIWLRAFLSEVLIPFTRPTTLFCNNQLAIALARDSQFHARTKHIDIRYHFI